MLVFLLHGVNTKTVQYADSLPDLIKEEFQKNNSPLPFFYSGFWGDNLKGTHAIWREIYQELHRKKTQNPNFNPDIAFRYQKFREVYFSEFLGDTFTYLNSENGKKIRNVIVQQFNDFLNTYSQEKEVHFIAHSLGTVILWDVLFSDRFQSDDPAIQFRKLIKGFDNNQNRKVFLKSITTLGCPIPFLNLTLDVDMVNIKRFSRKYKKSPLKWLNIIHSSDILAYPMRSILRIDDSWNLDLQDRHIEESANSIEDTIKNLVDTDFAKFLGQINPEIKNALSSAPILFGAAEAHSLYWNNRKVAQWITKIILPDTTTIISKTKNLEQVLEQLKQVEGMTFFDEKTKNTKYGKISSNDIKLEELEFKDKSGFLFLSKSVFGVYHIRVFDKNKICVFAGYVGWIHVNGLIEQIDLISQKFCIQ